MWCDNSKFNKMDDNKVDEITRLAMNIYSNKGVYTLLLGSGISLSAGILSGWKVTEDLLKKLSDRGTGSHGIPMASPPWHPHGILSCRRFCAHC